MDKWFKTMYNAKFET